MMGKGVIDINFDAVATGMARGSGKHKRRACR